MKSLFPLCLLVLSLNTFAQGGGMTGNGETVVQNASGEYEIADPYYTEPQVVDLSAQGEAFEISPETLAYFESAKRILKIRDVSSLNLENVKIRLVEQPGCNDTYTVEKNTSEQVACVYTNQMVIQLHSTIFPALSAKNQAMVLLHEMLHLSIFDHKKLTQIVTLVKQLVDRELEQNQNVWQKLSIAEHNAAYQLTLLLNKGGIDGGSLTISDYGGVLLVPTVKELRFTEIVAANRIALSSKFRVIAQLNADHISQVLGLSQEVENQLFQYIGAGNFKKNTLIDSNVTYNMTETQFIEDLRKAYREQSTRRNKFKVEVTVPQEGCKANFFKKTEVQITCQGKLNRIEGATNGHLNIHGDENVISNLVIGGQLKIRNRNKIVNSEYSDAFESEMMGSGNTIIDSTIKYMSMGDNNVFESTKTATQVFGGWDFRDSDNFAIGSNNVFKNSVMLGAGVHVDSKSAKMYSQLISNSVITNSSVPVLTGNSFEISDTKVVGGKTHFHNGTDHKIKISGLKLVNECDKFAKEDVSTEPINEWIQNIGTSYSEGNRAVYQPTGCAFNAVFKANSYDFNPKKRIQFSIKASKPRSVFNRSFRSVYHLTETFESVEEFMSKQDPR